MKQLFLIATLVTTLIFSGCKKNDEATFAKFSVKEKTTTLKSTNAGTFTFTKALIGISKIDFEIDTKTIDQDYKYKGAFQFDLLTGTSTPSMTPVEIIPGTYHDLEIKVDKTLSSGNSIEIAGTYDDGDLYNFEFSSTLDEDYDVENTTGIDAVSGKTINFTLYLDLPKLFNNVDFANVVADNDNIIRINKNSNASIASTIEDNFDDIMDFDDDYDD